MFHRIVVAYNESPEAQRALSCAIQLASSLHAELQTITVMTDLPAYAAFAEAGDPSLSQVLEQDRLRFYTELQEKARVQAHNHDIEVKSHMVEGHAVESIVDFLRRQKADLLVIGLHPRELYISRLWSTVYGLAQDAPCSVLGVH